MTSQQRENLCEYLFLIRALQENGKNSEAVATFKRKYRKLLKVYSRTNDERVVVAESEDGERWKELYTVEHNGTKQELLEKLWETQATKIYSDYDCTGKAFTSGFRVGHIKGNLWRVCESFARDV